MKFAAHDFQETGEVADILDGIEKMNAAAAEKSFEEISIYQPILISLLKTYQMELPFDALNEVTKMVFAIWEFFKDKDNIKRRKVSEGQFNRVNHKNVKLVDALTELDYLDTKTLMERSLDRLTSKALLTGIVYMLQNNSVLLRLPESKRGLILMEMTSMIEGFEQIQFKRISSK